MRRRAKNLRPVMIEQESLRRSLEGSGWKQQDQELSMCTNQKATISVHWWNHGDNVLLEVQQVFSREDEASMLFVPASNIRTVRGLIREGGRVIEDSLPRV